MNCDGRQRFLLVLITSECPHHTDGSSLGFYSGLAWRSVRTPQPSPSPAQPQPNPSPAQPSPSPGCGEGEGGNWNEARSEAAELCSAMLQYAAHCSPLSTLQLSYGALARYCFCLHSLTMSMSSIPGSWAEQRREKRADALWWDKSLSRPGAAADTGGERQLCVKMAPWRLGPG